MNNLTSYHAFLEKSFNYFSIGMQRFLLQLQSCIYIKWKTANRKTEFYVPKTQQRILQKSW